MVCFQSTPASVGRSLWICSCCVWNYSRRGCQVGNSYVNCQHSSFFMAALWNRAGHYIFVLWFISFLLLFFSPNLSGRRLDVYHTSTQCGLSANLECWSEMCCTQLAGNTGRKNDAKISVPAPSHNFIGLYLHN